MFRLILIGMLCSGIAAAEFTDPTTPLRTKAGTTTTTTDASSQQQEESDKQPKLQLNAIITADLEKKAIISGRVVRVGDKIPGGIVVAIRSSTVLLEINGIKQELFLFNGNIKIEVDE